MWGVLTEPKGTMLVVHDGCGVSIDALALALQTQPLPPHTYQSSPWQWPLITRPIWYLYESVEGVQRGVLLVGNPAVMWGGLVALAACLWDGAKDRRPALLGLSALIPGFSGLAIMPGTHSKWAILEGTTLRRFSSAMTGEIFELLRTHSVLRHSLNGELEGEDRDIGFEAGLALGLDKPERLTATLFKVRAGALLSGRSPAWCAGFLSGLLIGAEIGGQRDWLGDAEIPLIGGTGLCTLYAKGFAMVDARTKIIDAAEATLAGLKTARSEAMT